MSDYHGDFSPGKTVRLGFNTNDAAGLPITLAGGVISVHKDGSTTQSTAGATLSVDFDSLTGHHVAAIDTSADGTFYAAGSDFRAYLSAGTVDGTSVVGALVGSFSLAARSALRPTTADRTLDVSSTGEAGLDWANVGSPTTTVVLGGTTVGAVTATASVTAGVELSSTGLDAVVVETGVNARQALAIIGSSVAGKAAGLDTSTATFYAIGASGTSTVRGVYTVDASGNRTASTLTPPA